MKITEIKNLDLFKYSLFILAGSIVLLFVPFVFFLDTYQHAGKNTLVNLFYVFACFGVAVLVVNALLLFWILNQIIKRTNLQYAQNFESHFFQLLNYVHETAVKVDPKMRDEVHHELKNFLLNNKDNLNEVDVKILMSSFRNSLLKPDANASVEIYFRQLSTLLMFVFSEEEIDQEKYISILESVF